MSALGNKLRSGVKNAKLWAGIFVAYVFVREGIGAWQLNNAMNATLRIAIVNGQTYFVGDAVPLMQAREEHLRTAKEAAITMYGRNPRGLDDEQTLKRLFDDKPQKIITESVSKDAMTFLSQNRTQSFKPTGDIYEVTSNTDTCTMLVEGDVVSDSVIQGRVIPESKAVRIIFRLERNAKFGENGKFPLIVTRFDADYLHLAEIKHNVAEVK